MDSFAPEQLVTDIPPVQSSLHNKLINVYYFARGGAADPLHDGVNRSNIGSVTVCSPERKETENASGFLCEQRELRSRIVVSRFPL